MTRLFTGAPLLKLPLPPPLPPPLLLLKLLLLPLLLLVVAVEASPLDAPLLEATSRDALCTILVEVWLCLPAPTPGAWRMLAGAAVTRSGGTAA